MGPPAFARMMAGKTIAYRNSHILLAWNTEFVQSPVRVFILLCQYKGAFFIPTPIIDCEAVSINAIFTERQF
jgi:hypothetical protein